MVSSANLFLCLQLKLLSSVFFLCGILSVDTSDFWRQMLILGLFSVGVFRCIYFSPLLEWANLIKICGV